MFDSGITVERFIEDIKAEADIAPDISDKKFVSWINALEQVLYSDVILEQCKTDIEVIDSEGEYIYEVPVNSSDDKAYVRFEDIVAVFNGSKQLIKTTLLSGAMFDDCWFDNGGKLFVHTILSEGDVLTVFYHSRPVEKTTENLGTFIMLPAEFMDLMYSYVRAEAYKYANEDGLSAKWQAEYNARLETFKAWIEARRSNFGL